jgi:hypothetical protein
MNRDFSLRQIMIAVLIGCAVFAGGKFEYGFQISKYDIIGIAISLAEAFGLAVLILVFRDKVTLKPNLSAEERDAELTKARIASTGDGQPLYSLWHSLHSPCMGSDLKRNPSAAAERRTRRTAAKA